ncbi:hypothetical protein Tco_0023544 [Tanacetum coccineum]
MSLDEESSRVTYTSVSSEFEEPSDACSPRVIAPPSPDYVPRPEYPEYLAPSDVELPIKDQPYVTYALPTTLSLGYITDSDPKDESEDGATCYPADRGDDNDDDSFGMMLTTRTRRRPLRRIRRRRMRRRKST